MPDWGMWWGGFLSGMAIAMLGFAALIQVVAR